MTPIQNFLNHWYFHIPNLVMAALIYTLIGRAVLELLLAKRPGAVLLHVFRSITSQVVGVVRFVTPAIVPDGLVVVFSIVWLLAARILWFLACVAAGMRLSLGAI